MYNVIKRAFTFSVVATTMMWSIGVAALIPSVAQGATCPTLAAGDMIKVTGKAAIYSVNNDLKVLYFPSGDEFKSWRPTYGGYTSITQACFDSLSVPSTYPGGVNYHPGSYLVKRPSSDQLYVVLPGNSLSKIDTAVATSLYGTSTYTGGVGAKVMTVADTFWPHYVYRGADITTVKAHPGMLVKVSGITYLVDADNKLREVTTTGFTANGFQERFVRTVTADAISGLATGTTINAEVLSLTDKTQSGGVTPSPISSGNVTVALAASTPGAQDIPENASVEFLKLTLTNTGSTDASLTGIKLSAYGLGDASQIDQVSVYSNNQRYGNAKDVDSNKQAQINFTTSLTIAKGATETLVVKAQVTGTGHYALGVAAAADVLGVTAGGSFPIQGNTMSGVAVAVGQLTIENDGTTLASINLGDKAATIAKFKVTNDNVEDISFKSINLKRDSASTANDTAVENLKLYVDGAEVASASAIVGKYVSFTLTSPITILKNGMKRFTVKGDAVDGAGKFIKLMLDANSDVSAIGSHYGFSAIIVNTFTGADLTINAGAVSIEKINAANTKLLKSTTDVEFGTFKITANSGKTVELSTLKLKVVSVNDAVGAQFETFEIFDKYNNTVYDMTSTTGDGVYKNTSMGLILNSGITHELVVRADIKSTATNGDYTVSILDAAGGDVVLKETGNDTLITDITPNSVSLNKVQVEGATATFSLNALSAAYSAVVGSSDHELLTFNIKAGQAGQIKVTELKFLDSLSTSTKYVVSEFKLYKGTDLVKTVSGSQLTTAYEIAFTDLMQTIEPNESIKYTLKASLVNDSNNGTKQMRWRLSGYSAEETNKGTVVYDSVADNTTQDGIINGAEVGMTSLKSARTLTIVGYGMLNAAVDNTVTLTKYDTWQLAGTNEVPVATFKFRADNESIKVTSFKVVGNLTETLSNNITELALYDGTSKVAYATTIGAVTTTLDQDFIVDSTEKVYTLKASLAKIGLNEPGNLNVSTTFKLNGIEAEGVNSGHTLVADANNACIAGEICYESGTVLNYTSASKQAGIVASKAQTVSLVSSYSGYSLATSIVSTSSANAAIIAITVPATNNNNADGTTLKYNISRIKVNVANNVTSYTATLQRIGGVDPAVTSSVSGAYTEFNTSHFATTDDDITPGETAYFIVKITPVFTATLAGEKFIKVNLDKLDGTAVTNDASGTNFTWTDRAAGANNKISIRMPGVSNIDGTQIVN
ncbi:MAG: hypothetical protein NTW66_04385 [Candidatus Magasanikbacteria bacterium]|nr:hypothetical protein [Candidatus Magasanikbacteria bacterium]